MEHQTPGRDSPQDRNQPHVTAKENNVPQTSRNSLTTPPKPPAAPLKHTSPHDHTEAQTPLSRHSQQYLTSPEQNALAASPGAASSMTPNITSPAASAPRSAKRKAPHDEAEAQTPLPPIVQQVRVSPQQGSPGPSPRATVTPTRLSLRPAARANSESPANLTSPEDPKTPTSASRLRSPSTPVNEDLVQATNSYTPMQLRTMTYISPEAANKASDAASAARMASGRNLFRKSPHHGEEENKQKNQKDGDGWPGSAGASKS